MHRFLLICFLFWGLMLYPGCQKESGPVGNDDESNTDTSEVVVRKPNIYLYPETEMNLRITLSFPSGGSVTESIPAYGSGWDVSVTPDGQIDGIYDYLFYECETPDLYQYNKGWTVPGDNLKPFFEEHLLACGFNQREITDFTEFWIPLLSPQADYLIYPQFRKDIDPVIALHYSVEPASLLRLFFVIRKKPASCIQPEEPLIPRFERVGFTVTEWGVILK